MYINEVDVHIIDAELKDDPNFKFRICTGFSEVPTFTIVYDYATNYRNIRIHNDYVTNFQNAKHITLNNETYTRTPYSKECAINYYKNALIFDENSSVEEIAQELASYDGIYERRILSMVMLQMLAFVLIKKTHTNITFGQLTT